MKTRDLIRTGAAALLATGVIIATPTAGQAATKCSVWKWVDIPSVVMRACHSGAGGSQQVYVQAKNVGAKTRKMHAHVSAYKMYSNSVLHLAGKAGTTKSVAPNRTVKLVTARFSNSVNHATVAGSVDKWITSGNSAGHIRCGSIKFAY